MVKRMQCTHIFTGQEGGGGGLSMVGQVVRWCGRTAA